MKKNVIIIISAILVSMLLWNTIFLYPLKLMVVLMHETGHALAALLTGGSVLRVEVNALQGGVTYTSGGNRFIILSAGYLGSCFIGASILWSASHKTMSKYIAELFGCIIILITIFWVRDLFTFIFAVSMGSFCMLLGWKVKGPWEKLFMQFLGTVCCLYAVIDIFEDILVRSFVKNPDGYGKSDAEALAELTMIPSIVWGAIWIVIAIAVFFLTIKNLPKDLKQEKEPEGS